MPRNGTGSYIPPTSSWNPPVVGVNASNIDWAALLADLSDAMSQSLSSDGQTPLTGALSMGNNKLTNLANGTALTDAVTVGQLYPLVGQSGSPGSRQRLINASFLINQRAVSGSVVLAAGAYGHDRWKAGSGGCSYTFSTSAGVTTINISAGTLVQVVEGSGVEGGIYCMSWTGTAQGKIGGGTFGASGVVSTSQTGGSNLSVEFGTGTLANVQLEPGNTVTQLERKPIALEMSLCQRYYETGSGLIAGYAGIAGPGVPYQTPVYFKATKRAVPTLSYTASATSNVTAFDIRNADIQGAQWHCEPTAVGTFIWSGKWTATAEL